jgi:hypothetical protein
MDAPSSRSRATRAATEFTVIVAGVLTAFAVDEWREAAEEEDLRQQYVAGLAEEIELEISYLGFVADLCRERLAASDRVLLFLGQPAGLSSNERGYEAPTEFVVEELPSDLAAASKTQFFVPEAVVWEDLVATGNLRLLADLELRRRVSRYYTQIRYQERDRDQLFARFTALEGYLLSAGVTASTPAGIEGRLEVLRSLTELAAYVRAARDTQAEVLLRTLELRMYADSALASLVQ